MAETRIIHGFHAVTARIRQNADSVLEIYVDSQRRDPRARDLLKLAETSGVRIVPVDGKRLDGMAGKSGHQGVAARVDAALKVIHLDDVLDTLTEPALLLVLLGVIKGGIDYHGQHHLGLLAVSMVLTGMQMLFIGLVADLIDKRMKL